ncbi:hypothetical protein OJ253_3052 [Cryptosporidium canis]|uniref:Uncharacterized protein n=1 Tax=Cryptosporidium canis TaxID=195482 RepID=A0A9D5DI81_9CRYT|nr:hypothetical protein OJ253_3052 [Cryptosporidium canis]
MMKVLNIDGSRTTGRAGLLCGGAGAAQQGRDGGCFGDTGLQRRASGVARGLSPWRGAPPCGRDQLRGNGAPELQAFRSQDKAAGKDTNNHLTTNAKDNVDINIYGFEPHTILLAQQIFPVLQKSGSRPLRIYFRYYAGLFCRRESTSLWMFYTFRGDWAWGWQASSHAPPRLDRRIGVKEETSRRRV